MTYKIPGLMALALALMALPLGATGGAGEVAVEAAEVSAGLPQHGGKLTVYYWGGEAPTADRTTGGWQTNQ